MPRRAGRWAALKAQRGITLMELMIVLVIVGIIT
ncbi:MAG: prepilin-type N-terminal cleavage/methylation domain-containing protein, partial [Pseudomonadota bacterium]